MTDDSFLANHPATAGLSRTVKPHSGPINAAKLVSHYGCHVHPLKLGSKAPASKNGTSDAVPDATAIDGNYGVNAAKSRIVAVDLDDYVPGNLCDEFLAEFGLPPTFTVRTGSGGRSLWYRAPEGVTLRQKLGMWTGVDIKAGNSYVLGPGNKLAASEIKEGATGDGTYSFDKSSPREFIDLPQKLVEALTAKVATISVQSTGESAEYAELSESLRARVDGYVADAIERELATVKALAELEGNDRNEKGDGWESGTWHAAGSIASLVKATWNTLTYDDVFERWKEVVPDDGTKWWSHGVGMLPRTMINDKFPAREWPESLEEDDWWTPGTYRFQDFRAADGSGEAPPAEPVIVDDNPDDWPRQPWNEEGHVERTKQWAAGSLRWLKDEGIWVRYNGVHWERDVAAGAKAAEAAMKKARWTEQGNYDDTPKVDEKTGAVKPDSSERAKFVKALSDQSTDRMFNSVARVLGRREGIESASWDFDTDEMLLGVANGTVDLRTGELVPGTPDQMISMACPVEYDPAAKAPRFHEYLAESIPSEDVRLYLQRVIGYSITGSTLEQAFFMHYGEATNNGKSVLVYLVERMMGEYSGVADPKALIESRNDQHTTHIAGLAGPRVLMMSETARGARISDVLVKQITGGDRIKARKMHQDGQNYRIIGKIHMATNHLPHIVSSASTNRRIHVIPWDVQIENDKIDLELREKLAATELPGILAWAIEGARLWWNAMKSSQGLKDGERPTGLGMPAQVRLATDSYLGDEDEIGRWIEERTEIKRETFETASNLYENYKWWAEKAGGRAMTQTAFSLDLKKRGIEQVRKASARGFLLTLRPLQDRSYFNQ